MEDDQGDMPWPGGGYMGRVAVVEFFVSGGVGDSGWLAACHFCS